MKAKKNKDKKWKLIYQGFKPKQESLREALCTLGNGYLGVRGAAYESINSQVHYPGTYMAGLYNILKTRIAGKDILNEDLVNCPNWLFIVFRIGKDKWITPTNCKIIEYIQELDMKQACLSRMMKVEDKKGRITLVESKRFVSMADHHRCAIHYSITPLNYRDKITFRSDLDGSVENTGVARYSELNSKHFSKVKCSKYNRRIIALNALTSQSKIKISLAAKLRILSSGRELNLTPKVKIKNKKRISQEVSFSARKNKRYVFEKIVSIYTSRDKNIVNAEKDAVESAKNSFGFDVLLKAHIKAWDGLWKKFDIKIKGDDFSQKVLRLHTFHLLQTASPHNENIDAGLPARGLSGEAYRGHIFWDTAYVVPFYDLRYPSIAEALIKYRYDRLNEARKYAKADGYEGSMFPWQSGSSGKEQTQVIHLNPLSGKWGPDHSRIQRHVSFAIAYNAWNHWNRTQDINFLVNYGAELLLSIAKFASSLTKFNKKDNRYHTDGLMGPDEFHEKLPGRSKPGFKDNAYTNFFIVWTLLKALESLNIVPEKKRKELLGGLKISKKELKRWDDITRKMNIILNSDDIIAQFDGYFSLQELNWNAYRAKYGNIQRMDRILKAEGKSPDRYKCAKQADALMMFYFFPLFEIKDIFFRLGYQFGKNLLKKNYEYYVQRTSHGSTLSKVVHCYISHLLGKHKESWKWFLEVLKSDIYDIQGGTTPEGIHCGVMGGSINIVFKGFAGVTILEDRVRINPNLPKAWDEVSLRFYYKNNRIALTVSKQEIVLDIKGRPSSIAFEIYGKQYVFAVGKQHKISLVRLAKDKKWGHGFKMAQERILLIQGDVSFADELKKVLEDSGYLVELASSAIEARSFLKHKWVDLVILSENLKGSISGYRFFKDLKLREEFNSLPVIVTSNKQGLRKVFEFIGAKGYIVRPASDEEFLKNIQEVLRK